MPFVLATTGPSSSATPYLINAEPNVRFTSILTVGDTPEGGTYRMVGIPDGLGAWDNGDGTFTVVMNHELGATAGVVRAHGAAGAFVSKWVIDASDLSVVSGEDAITTVQLWDDVNKVFYTPTTPYAINRLCSADLAPQTAYQWTDPNTGITYGTATKIFMTGEEAGPESKEFGVVLEGAEAGIAYELAYTGLFSWENALSSPTAQLKTINIGLDDSSGGEVYMYVGDKKTTGTEVDKAGLNDGFLYGLRAASLYDSVNPTLNDETDALAASGRFEMVNLGDVSAITGAALETLSDNNGVTSFMRPEDGHWDPNNANIFYFLTTASFTGQSRMYKLTFDDIANPESGGTIEAVLSSSDLPANGGVGPRMMDNMTVAANGLIYIQEDVGGQSHTGRIFEYNPATDVVVEVAAHDVARFGSPTVAPTAPFNNDEESSGIIDVTDILGDDDTAAYLFDVQAHYNIPGELVQGGQFLAMYVDEVKDGGAGDDRVAGDGLDNTLNGFAGDDEMLGGSGNDVLLGGRGSDSLYGGRGSDVLQGGVDGDSFVLDTLVAGAVDVITDFNVSQDSLDLNGATVTGVQVSFLSTDATVNGFDVANSNKALDLVLTVSKDGVSQTVKILDAYNFASNGYWESELGIDLTYPRPLPSGSDLLAIA